MISVFISSSGIPGFNHSKLIRILSDLIFFVGVHTLCQEDPLKADMAPHSSILAWRIPWTEEPCGLQSTGLQRVGHVLVIKPPPTIVA